MKICKNKINITICEMKIKAQDEDNFPQFHETIFVRSLTQTIHKNIPM